MVPSVHADDPEDTMTQPNTPGTPPGEDPWATPGWTPAGQDAPSPAQGASPPSSWEPPPGAGHDAPPAWGAPVPPSWQPSPQPGVVPLRPLVLGDLFDGTFRAVRSNPAVMFGFSVLVMAVVSLVSAVIEWLTSGSLLASLDDPQGALTGEDSLTEVASQLSGALTGTLGTSVLTMLATILVTGVLALSVADAVLGKVTDLGDAWTRVKPRILPLVGWTILSALIVSVAFFLVLALFAIPLILTLSGGNTPGAGSVLILVLGVLVALLVTLFLSTRLLFGSVALVLEEIGPLAALRRSWTLTGPSFWRVLGRMVLITLVTAAATGVIAGAVSILGGVVMVLGDQAFGSALATFLSGTVSGFVIPIAAAFETLMYLDERMRQENFAQTLLDATRP